MLTVRYSSRTTTQKPKGGQPTDVQKTYNKVHNGLRDIGERGNSLLKTTFKALRNVSPCDRNIDKIVRAVLVVLHVEYGRTS
ncbi:transposase family protein [Dactylosporangium sp. NBC_01737]|uniref:transposase family protein n=1 Tax=Dactylosporangium sp. NBC_01737 TaxID=2975959 RepID=UPI003FA38546